MGGAMVFARSGAYREQHDKRHDVNNRSLRRRNNWFEPECLAELACQGKGFVVVK